MLLIKPLIIIFILSYAIYILLELNPLESIFISASGIIITMLIIVSVFGLQMSSYMLAGISFVAFCIAIYKSIRQKNFFKGIIQYINNPAFIVFLLSVSVYIFLVHDNHLYTWDDFSHWGLAVRSLIAFDGIHIASGILQPQTLGMPIFNAFIISLSGMNEGYMLSGMWFVYWACLLLPASGLKWNRAYTVAIYYVVMYAILMFMSHQPRPNLYCDAMLPVISGSLVAYYYVNKDKTKNYFIIIILGCVLLPHIKNATGILFSMLVFFLILREVYVSGKLKQNDIKKQIIISALAILASSIYSYVLKMLTGTGKFNEGQTWCHPLGDLIPAVASPLSLIFLLLSIALGIAAILLKNKKRKRSLPLFVSLCMTSIGFAASVIFKLEGNTKLLVSQFGKNILKLNIYGINLNLMLVVIISFIVIIYSFGIKKCLKKEYVKIWLVFLIGITIYTISLMLSYCKFSYAEGIKSACLDRYLLSAIAYPVIGGIGILMNKEKIWENRLAKTIIMGSLMLLTVVFIMPAPLTVYRYEKDIDYKTSYNYRAKIIGEEIISKVGMEGKVYVVTQGDSGHLANLLQYNSVPVFTSRENFSLCPLEEVKSDLDAHLTPTELSDYIISEGYTHLCILEIDDYFIDTYRDMFYGDANIETKKLYEIKKDGDHSVRFLLNSHS